MEFVQSGPGDDPVIVEGYFAAAPGLVFKAWTDPEIVVKWFGQAPNSLHSATIDLRPGGEWRFLITSDERKSVGFEGRYLDIRADEKLVFSWSHVITHADGEREATPFSRVEVDFTARGAKALMSGWCTRRYAGRRPAAASAAAGRRRLVIFWRCSTRADGFALRSLDAGSQSGKSYWGLGSVTSRRFRPPPSRVIRSLPRFSVPDCDPGPTSQGTLANRKSAHAIHALRQSAQ